MSIATVTARVAELQSLLSGGPAPSAPAVTTAAPPSSTSSFAQQLAGASSDPAAAGASSVSFDPAALVRDTRAVAAATTGTAVAGSSALPASVPYGAEITAAARRHGIDPALLAGLVRQESGFNAHAGSSAGAQGLTQLMPATARGLGVTDPFDPGQSIEGGAKYLAAQLQRFGGDVSRALAAYNAGPGAVERFGGVPPYAETQNYVRNVQAFAAGYRRQA